MQKVILPTTLVVASLLTFSAHAEMTYSFGNVSINYLEWDADTEVKTGNTKEDFSYLEIEGGAGFNWGEVYGFYDFEEWDKNSDKHRFFGKGNVRYFLGDQGWHLFGQVSDFRTKDFDETNTFLGIGKSFNFSNGLWLKAHAAIHHSFQSDKYGSFDGHNGYQLGVVWGKDFSALGQNFTVAQWHEYDFMRDDDYMASHDGSPNTSGYNGAISGWWHITDHFDVGVQYRYADDYLGSPTYQNGTILSLKYNF
ncbi:ion channel protein Tsx [Zooshikella marina]|uniref:outer membrane protein OmpK n=1 Tax=Zooshikella ganghwensis TaxID=202772 RepID=UPI001BAE5906|nr:outer membrane protein OmpK [Zooshikella ganghwensis]MBU2706505.1 ion channel protein Tsx [Zooshikella ganghwensis]